MYHESMSQEAEQSTVVISDEEMQLLKAVDAAIERAGEVMELGDLGEDFPEDEIDDIYEQRFHCGKCIVRTVMETIWDDLNNLMEYYSERKPS